MSTWTEETKKEAIKAYLDANPTAETSVEIVKELANEFDTTPNSYRMMLSQAGVYVKKTDAKSAASSGSSTKTKAADGDKPARRSKQTSLDELTAAIEAAGQEINEEVISKLTGKAADYFTSVITSINK
jgi:transposase-like protein